MCIIVGKSLGYYPYYCDWLTINGIFIMQMENGKNSNDSDDKS